MARRWGRKVCTEYETRARCLRLPIAMRRFHEQSLWIPRKCLPTNPDLRHGLLRIPKLSIARQSRTRSSFAARDGPFEGDGTGLKEHDPCGGLISSFPFVLETVGR